MYWLVDIRGWFIAGELWLIMLAQILFYFAYAFISTLLGQALLSVKDMMEMGVEKAMSGISASALVVGFLAAFITGCLACKWMIDLVKRGKMIYFAIYCAVVGVAVIIWQAA